MQMLMCRFQASWNEASGGNFFDLVVVAAVMGGMRSDGCCYGYCWVIYLDGLTWFNVNVYVYIDVDVS